MTGAVATAWLATGLAACSAEETPNVPDFTGPAASSSPPASAAASSDGAGGEATGPAGQDGSVTVTLTGDAVKGGDAVLTAIRGYTRDLAEALAEPADPPRSRWATPSGQSVIDDRAKSLLKRKQRVVGPIEITGQLRIRSGRATADGCLDQSRVAVYEAGEQAPLDEPERLPVTVLAGKRGSVWLVDSFSVSNDSGC